MGRILSRGIVKMALLDAKEKIICTLFYSRNHASNTTRLMKLMFIFDEIFKMYSIENEFDFKSLHLGAWSDNFDTFITPLILSDLITVREAELYRNYSFSTEKENQLMNFIENTYLENEDYKEQLDIIHFFSSRYDSELDSLIQFTYYLKPEFTQKSEILNKIGNLNPKFNQKIIIDLIKILPTPYLLQLIQEETIPGTLKFFNIIEDNDDYPSFKSLLIKIRTFIEDPAIFSQPELIKTISEISITSSLYKPLKFGLLSLFTKKIVLWEDKIYRGLLLFFYKSLSLDWSTIDTEGYNKFNLFLFDCKKNFDINTFLEGIPELTKEEWQDTIDSVDYEVEIKPEYDESIDVRDLDMDLGGPDLDQELFDDEIGAPNEDIIEELEDSEEKEFNDESENLTNEEEQILSNSEN
jgi:hypothetical protein